MRMGSAAIPVIAAKLPRPVPAPKRFGASPIWAALLACLALLGCGDGDEARADAIRDLKERASVRPAGVAPLPLILPDGEPTPEARLAFYLDLLVGGDRVEVEWATEQLVLAGESAIPGLAAELPEALEKNPSLAENILQVFEEGLRAGPALPAILRAADHEQGRIRMRAAVALGKSGDAEAVPALLDLAADGLYAVAYEAVRSLDRLGAEEGARGLKGRFPDRLQPGVRGLALGVVARRLPPSEAVPFLRAALESEELDIRIAAAGALLLAGDRSGLEPMIEIVRDGPPGQARYAALEVLARAEDPRAMPALAEMAASLPKADRIAAVGLLGYFRTDAARELLRTFLADPDEDLRREAMNSLVRSDPERALRETVRLLGSSRAVDRSLAALVLGAVRDPGTAEALARASDLEDDESVRMQLTTGLALVGDPAGAAAVVRTLLSETQDDPSLAVMARTAAVSLRRFDELPEDARALLRDAARSPLASVRFHATMPLGRAGRGPEAAAALTALLAEADPGARRLAAHAWLSFADATLSVLRSAHARETDPELAEEMTRVARQLYYRWPR